MPNVRCPPMTVAGLPAKRRSRTDLAGADGFGAGVKSDLSAFGQSEGIFDIHS